MNPIEWKSVPEELLSVRDCVRWAASRFAEAGLHFGHGTDNALDEAVALVLGALHLRPDLPPAYLDARLLRMEREHLARLMRRRIEERVPVPYLTGEAWFAGLAFAVDPRVLIPRSPFAELLERGFDPWITADRVGRILDLCTGSGCIAIAAAYHYPDAMVDAADVSDEALAVARTNIERHGVGHRVQARRSDLMAGLGDGRYDLILCNPPYVGDEELASLPPEFAHEPRLGLAGGEDGLDLVVRILDQAAERLSPGGIIVLEVGNSEDALAARFPKVPFLWLDLERGGGGVFLLTAEQLRAHRAEFRAATR